MATTTSNQTGNTVHVLDEFVRSDIWLPWSLGFQHPCQKPSNDCGCLVLRKTNCHEAAVFTGCLAHGLQ